MGTGGLAVSVTTKEFLATNPVPEPEVASGHAANERDGGRWNQRARVLAARQLVGAGKLANHPRHVPALRRCGEIGRAHV